MHAIYPYRFHRYCVPLGWAGLLLATYGAQSLLSLLENRWAGWGRVKSALLVSGALLFLVWTMGVARTLEYGTKLRVCPGIETTVGWSVAITIAGYLGYEWLRAARRGLRWATVPAFLALALVGSGTRTAALLGDGQTLISFKRLSLWFQDNARPGDKMVTTMPHYMPLYTGLPMDSFVQIGTIPPDTAPDLPSFVRACRQRGVTLIAWDSGLSNNTGDRYYRLWGLERLRPLGQPFTGPPVRRIGSCELVQIVSQDWPKVAVWRILPEN